MICERGVFHGRFLNCQVLNVKTPRAELRYHHIYVGSPHNLALLRDPVAEDPTLTVTAGFFAAVSQIIRDQARRPRALT